MRSDETHAHRSQRFGAQNLTLRNNEGNWELQGVIDFGMTAPSSIAREARYATAINRSLGRQMLRYVTHSHPDLLSEEALPLAEKVAATWAGLQVIMNLHLRIIHGTGLRSAPVKLHNLDPSTNWPEVLEGL